MDSTCRRRRVVLHLTEAGANVLRWRRDCPHRQQRIPRRGREAAPRRPRAHASVRTDADIAVDLAKSQRRIWSAHQPRVLVHGAGVMSSDVRCMIDHARIGANVLTALPGSVEHLVLVSSAYVYPPSATPLGEDTAPAPAEAYGHAKVMIEALFRGFAKANGQRLTILRPCAIFGPNDPHRKAVTAFAAAARGGNPPTLTGKFREPRDYIHVDDAARAVAAAVDASADGTFNVCTGHAWSAAAIVDLIAENKAGAPRFRSKLPARGPDRLQIRPCARDPHARFHRPDHDAGRASSPHLRLATKRTCR